MAGAGGSSDGGSVAQAARARQRELRRPGREKDEIVWHPPPFL